VGRKSVFASGKFSFGEHPSARLAKLDDRDLGFAVATQHDAACRQNGRAALALTILHLRIPGWRELRPSGYCSLFFQISCFAADEKHDFQS